MASIMYATRLKIETVRNCIIYLVFGYTAPSRQWLPTELGRKAEEHLNCFLSGYYRLACWAFRNKLLLYRFVPKLHSMKHVQLKLRDELALQKGWTHNPAMYGTANDEDFVGIVSRPVRELHSTNAPLRRLELYRIQLKESWG